MPYFQQLSRRDSTTEWNLVCGYVTHDRSHQTAWFCEGRPSEIEGSRRPEAKCRRGLLGLFAHHVVGELCQNLRDGIHQSRNRKSSTDSGYCLTACSLSLCTVSKQALGVYRFRNYEWLGCFLTYHFLRNTC